MVHSYPTVMISFEDFHSLMRLDAAYWARADKRIDVPPESLFAETGSLTLGSLELQGRQAIAKFFDARDRQNADSQRITRHVASGLTIESSRPDSVILRSVVLVFAGLGDLPLEAGVPSTIADVSDVCAKGSDGAWLFERRIVKPVFVGAGAAKFAR